MEIVFFGIIAVVVLVLLVTWFSTYSKIAALGSQVDLAVGTLAAQLQQRHDLIPDVLKAAKEAVKVQMQYLDQILAVRKSLNVPLQQQSQVFDDMPPELRPLAATAQNAGHNRPVNESNPQMNVGTYEKLQEIMQSTEKDVSGARRFLQSAISEYNTAVRSFPGSLVASVHGFVAMPTERITPQLERKPNYWLEQDSQRQLEPLNRQELWRGED